MGTLLRSNAHDLSRAVDEVVPKFAAKGDGVVKGFEGAAQKPVIADILPDVPHRVEFC